MAFSFSASGAARWLVSVAMRRACCAARSSAATALSSAASLACSSTSNGLGSIRYSGSPAVHLGALLEQALDDDAGDARANFRNPGGRDPAGQFAHEGAGLRPYGEGADFGLGRFCRYAVAAIGSLQPAKSGAIAANIKTMHADRV